MNQPKRQTFFLAKYVSTFTLFRFNSLFLSCYIQDPRSGWRRSNNPVKIASFVCDKICWKCPPGFLELEPCNHTTTITSTSWSERWSIRICQENVNRGCIRSLQNCWLLTLHPGDRDALISTRETTHKNVFYSTDTRGKATEEEHLAGSSTVVAAFFLHVSWLNLYSHQMIKILRSDWRSLHRW